MAENGHQPDAFRPSPGDFRQVLRGEQVKAPSTTGQLELLPPVVDARRERPDGPQDMQGRRATERRQRHDETSQTDPLPVRRTATAASRGEGSSPSSSAQLAATIAVKRSTEIPAEIP